MKQKKTILMAMIVLTFALLILANLLHGLGRLVAYILMLASLVMFILVWAKLWRCPHCGKHLGRMADWSGVCPHCGEKLED